MDLSWFYPLKVKNSNGSVSDKSLVTQTNNEGNLLELLKSQPLGSVLIKNFNSYLSAGEVLVFL